MRREGLTTDVKVSRSCPPPVPKGRQGEFQPGFHGPFLRHVRRLQSFCQGLRSGRTDPSVQAHRIELWSSVLAAPGFQPSFASWWDAHPVALVGDPPAIPAFPCLQEAESIWASMQANVIELEQRVLRTRCREALERRKRQPSLIFWDVSRPKAAPVDSLVMTVAAPVLEVRQEEEALVLGREAQWMSEGHFSLDGCPFFPIHVEPDMVWGLPGDARPEPSPANPPPSQLA